MSENTGSLSIDPLFVGLTRPPMLFGVSYTFVLVNAFVCFLYYIQTSDLLVFIMAGALHLIGYIICFKEPLFIELYMVKFQKCNRCRNKLYYGGNSYDPY